VVFDIACREELDYHVTRHIFKKKYGKKLRNQYTAIFVVSPEEGERWRSAAADKHS